MLGEASAGTLHRLNSLSLAHSIGVALIVLVVDRLQLASAFSADT